MSKNNIDRSVVEVKFDIAIEKLLNIIISIEDEICRTDMRDFRTIEQLGIMLERFSTIYNRFGGVEVAQDFFNDVYQD